MHRQTGPGNGRIHSVQKICRWPERDHQLKKQETRSDTVDILSAPFFGGDLPV